MDGPQFKGYPHYDAKVARKRAALGDECEGSDDERIHEDWAPDDTDHGEEIEDGEPGCNAACCPGQSFTANLFTVHHFCDDHFGINSACFGNGVAL